MRVFERAAAVGLKVLGVGNGADCYGVRVDPASFDRAVEALEAADRLAIQVTWAARISDPSAWWDAVDDAATAFIESRSEKKQLAEPMCGVHGSGHLYGSPACDLEKERERKTTEQHKGNLICAHGSEHATAKAAARCADQHLEDRGKA